MTRRWIVTKSWLVEENYGVDSAEKAVAAIKMENNDVVRSDEIPENTGSLEYAGYKAEDLGYSVLEMRD